MKRLLRLLLSAVLLVLVLGHVADPLRAAQRNGPAWWDPDGVGAGADWHYRVPVSLPAVSALNNTARVDIDFAALMAQLGITGTFDANSVRVVRPGGTLVAVQEYTDTVYGGASDSNSTRGEVRWIVEDGGAQTYYVYFDITQNGTKPANPQVPINGNFEHSAAGTQLPAGWLSATKGNATYDMQVRPAETVNVNSDGNPYNNPHSTNGDPLTGAGSYLLGARTNLEPSNGAISQIDATVLTRTIAVPAGNPGSLTIHWRTEGWDSDTNGVTTFDNIHIRIVTAGGAATEIVGPATNAYTTYPFSPNYGPDPVGTGNSGYGQYNGFDTTLTGTHTLGVAAAQHSEPWFSRSYSLAAFAGQTVTLRIGTTHMELYKSWFHIDDVEWSVVTGSLGSAQGFGVAALSPLGSQPPGRVLKVQAVVDARPTAAANPVAADIYNSAGTLVAAGIRLYNDGTHGDAVAGDATWTNSGADAANPTYTIPLASGSSSGWLVRVFARDASTSTQSAAANGLVHRSGQPAAQVMANWWNIDDAGFSVDAAVLAVSKASTVVSDGVNTANFKAIPGARVRYCLTIGNTGTASASSLVATDSLPATLSYVAGTLASGSDCATAATPEDDNTSGSDESDPVGASFTAGVVTINRSALAVSGSFAVTYQATIN